MTIAERPDLRALALGAAGWAAAILVGARVWPVVGAILGVLVLVALRSGGDAATPLGWALAFAAVGCSAALHAGAIASSPVVRLAEEGASVHGVLTVRSEPVPSRGRFGTRVWFEAGLHRMEAGGRVHRVRAPVLVLLDDPGRGLRRGSRIEVRGVLRPSDRAERAAVLAVRGSVRVLAGPAPPERAAARVRSAIREAVEDRPAGPRALVPALVDGEDGELPERITADFTTTGLTHLLAVSGTNLTLILGCVLLVARRCRVRSYGLILVGALGVAGFVLLAGPEPSVLRAAAMGTIALVGLGSGGRRNGLRTLGLGVLALLVLDPWLARSAGFALSVCATAGILLLGPPWRDALARWLPRWLAEVCAVPLAAQVACTPLVAALSGSVSLVAVAANVVAAPLVGPATVLGLAGGLVTLVVPALGELIAVPAAWSASGIIAVATHGASLHLPAVAWSTAVLPLVLLTGLTVAAALTLHRLLARRGCSLACVAIVTGVVLVPLPTPGWPPPGWVLVACSVGQGDGLVLAIGRGSAVVVDVGPDPRLIDRCLRRLRVRAVPMIVLTHFHADHIDGLAGVLRGRRVREIVTSPLQEPAAGAATVHREAARAGASVRAAAAGELTSIGAARWQVLGPPASAFPDSESPPNDASLVLLVEVRGIRLLLMGDQERPSQAALRRSHPGLRADVLKVAHHGSSKQDADLIDGLGARLAMISVGAGNDYGHPAGSALALLERAGMPVRRTDLDGDVAVVVDAGGRLSTVSRGGPP
ncbi:ComEC/Rec2 family competence protein [Nocardioides marmoriginsengisoli]|uniref:ComEC/Rec2 family competence protein n=1 Tax=Nocardioides marmoriginsengisoli TaxID=661483 RepID=A0A3N0CKE0_9ACTN|nr:ComEC/Rec2 family competence protein [Nocardioides marmoriginsengisoli]RNL63741.1 ComEC/Rec2 family competence protein [Nocardioides marmoriginsengisoli]